MSDDPKDLAPFPEESNVTEALRTVIKAGASLFVPGTDLLDLLSLRIQRRQAEWFRELAERLKGLEAEQRLSVEAVVSSPRIQDAIVAALESVRGSRDRDKRDALRNAVLNAALGASGDDVQQDLFLRLVDRFTVWHIRLLKVFEDSLVGHGRGD